MGVIPWSLKLADSGQIPVSKIPMIVSRPLDEEVELLVSVLGEESILRAVWYLRKSHE